MIDIVTAAIAMATIAFVHVPQPETRQAQMGETSASYLADLRAGLRYILNWRGLMLLGGMDTLINMLGPTTSFMPLLITDHFSGTAWHLGLIEAAFGIVYWPAGFC